LKIFFIADRIIGVYNGALRSRCSEALQVEEKKLPNPMHLDKRLLDVRRVPHRSRMRFADNASSKMKPLKRYRSLRYTPKIRHGPHSCVSEENLKFQAYQRHTSIWQTPGHSKS